MDCYLNWLGEGGQIVTATRRLARHIRIAHDGSLAAEGQRCWAAPVVSSWDDWLVQQWRHALGSDGATGRLRLLQPMQASLLWEQIVAGSGHVDAYASIEGIFRKAQAASAKMCRYDIPAEALHASARTPDQRAFASWLHEYRRRCEAEQLADTHELARVVGQAIAAGELTVAQPVGFAGFDRHLPEAERLIEQIRGAGTRAERLEPDATNISCRSMVCTDTTAEIEAAARWARQVYVANPDARIGIVVPDLADRAADVRCVFRDALQPGWRLKDSSQPFDISYGERLSAAGVIQTAMILLEFAAGPLDYRDAGQLLRSPYLPGWSCESSARARLDTVMRDRLGRGIRLGDLARMAAGMAGIDELSRRLAQLDAEAPATRALPGSWGRWFSELLARIGWPGDRSLNDNERQAVQAWFESLDQLAMLDSVSGDMPAWRARQLLSRILHQRLIQVPGPGAGPQVMGLLEAAGSSFDHLWVTGLTADLWPPSWQPEPFIPSSLRLAHGLPDATPAHALERARRQLEAMISGAPDVVLSWSRQRDDEVLVPSPLLLETGARPVSADVTTVAFAELPYDEQLAGRGALERVDSDVPAPASDARQFHGGSRLLGLQAECPARAFFEFRLGAREIPVPAIAPDARQRGIVTHEILQQLYEPLIGQEGPFDWSGPEIGQRISELAVAALARRVTVIEKWQQAVVDLEVRRLGETIARALQLDSQRPRFTLVQIEQKSRVEIGGLGLGLRLDRVDRLADGGELVIDYKTGKVRPSEWRKLRIREPQLPIYAVALGATAIAFFRIDEGEIEISGISSADFEIDGLVPIDRAAREPGLEWSTQLQRWRDSLEALAHEFIAGDVRIPAAPSRRRSAAGQYAALTRVFGELTARGEDLD